MDWSPQDNFDWGDLDSDLPDPETDFGIEVPSDSHGILLVQLQTARGIADSQVSAYCSLRVGAQRAKSSVAEKHINPVWDESFNFVITDSDKMLKFVILNKDILSACELCTGQVTISPIFHPSNYWVTKNVKVRLSRGHLEVRLRYIPTKNNTSHPESDRYGFNFEGLDWRVDQQEQALAFAQESIDWQCSDRPPDDPAKAELKGISLAYKATFWEYYAKSLHIPEKLFEKDCYQSLLKQEPIKIHKDHIELDIPRTFPGHLAFQHEKGKEALRRVLIAMTLWNPSMGYCQSMNNVVALLLLVTDEERAFRLAVILIYYIIGDYHSNNMLGLQVDQHVLNDLVEVHLPELHAHLKSIHVNIVLYMTGWFLNLFSCCFPFPTVLRLWDVVFCEGSSSAVVRISLATLKTLQTNLLAVQDIASIPEVLGKPNSLCYNWNAIIESLQSLPNVKELDKLREKATYTIVERYQESMIRKLGLFKIQHLHKLRIKLCAFKSTDYKITKKDFWGIFSGLFPDFVDDGFDSTIFDRPFEACEVVDLRAFLLGVCPLVTGNFAEKTDFVFKLFDQDKNNALCVAASALILTC